ncbi:hypothetical protein TD95_004989 [Thielaviopsis punctulata]|uniref:Rho-GAP domain-containing protein n=1 Tax=Thielaviopsis punctulata TaxID=72032 RepID=A0A0F4ZMD3_9PEZI|nr:hypothetical protein TD95_004989 [Thielaviopsis punctulata]
MPDTSKISRPIPSPLHTSITASNSPSAKHDNRPATEPLQAHSPSATATSSSPTFALGPPAVPDAFTATRAVSGPTSAASNALNNAILPSISAVGEDEEGDEEEEEREPAHPPQSPTEKQHYTDGIVESAFYSDSSLDISPDRSQSLRPIPPAVSLNDHSPSRSASGIPLTPSITGLPPSPMPASAVATSQAVREARATNPMRQSSMDSVLSAISAKAKPGSTELSPGRSSDIESLINTAGSAEAVIRYLLKDKHSQSQQNAQLWRLVDKQRAMILGLNKDLERALKDKERYRKKLKDVLATQNVGSVDVSNTLDTLADNHSVIAHDNVPDSPSLDSDAAMRNSPVGLAPYPITPPADQGTGPTSAVGELLDPEKAMPKPEEHAYDKFNVDAEELEAQRKRQQEQESNELHIKIGIPSSRTLPSPTTSRPPAPPPSQPPPAPPSMARGSNARPQATQDLEQFPSPPRKAPPPALNLSRKNTLDDKETDTEYEVILDVKDGDKGSSISSDKRGRRRTREEDDYMRSKIAIKEMEARSQSKKTKEEEGELAKLNSVIDGTPLPEPAAATANVISPSFGQNRANAPPPLMETMKPQQNSQNLMTYELMAPLRSPGLPISPRPGAQNSSMPMNGGPTAAPLSPRQPRQVIPMPSNMSIQGGISTDPAPSPMAPVKRSATAESGRGTDSPTERRHIFKGFQTEDHPDLLLTPNSLISVMVRVASSRMKPSRASLMSLTQLEEDPVFTLAVVSRNDGGELWRVEKDIISLSKLDQRLKAYPQFTARTPDRALFSGHSPAKLDARRVALEHYWDDVLKTSFDRDTAMELCKYLSANTLPPNFDEAWQPPASSNKAGQKPTDTGGRPSRSGYLTKKGKNFGGWKARYFVLGGGPTLKYYETPGGAHLGTIKLQHAQIGKQASHNDAQASGAPPTAGAAAATTEDFDNQYRHAFLIMEPKKKDSTTFFKHVLCAENDEERDQWVSALIQWIDYRDPDSDAKHSERPMTSGAGSNETNNNNSSSSSSSSSKSKKRHQTKGSSAHAKGSSSSSQQNSGSGSHLGDSDALIGVSYDSTKQGHVPARENNRNTMIGLPQNPRDNDPQAKENVPAISGPQNGQVIADATTWGSRLSQMPTGTATSGSGANGMLSLEEKKQRKRSFFGFGPKARSSSEGQDTLFDNPAPYTGPVRQVFGAQLSDAVRYNRPTDVNVPLPCVVYRCIQYLDSQNAVNEEGIFRLSGSNVVIKALKERFNSEGDINLVTDSVYYDIHAVASLLKLYLRELPTTILTREMHLEFMTAMEIPNMGEKCAVLGELVSRLPQANATLLKYLIAFLIKIINNSAVNKMTVRNVGIVFSPTLNIPAPVFALFLQNYEAIFEIEPENYELPMTLMSEDSAASSVASRPSFDPIPPRPATSSGASASPHRQRLMEQAARNSPTPPLLQDLNSVRGAATPTPPPGGMNFSMPQAYEPKGHGYGHGHGHGYGHAENGSVGSGSEMAMLGVPQEGGNSRRRESAIYGFGGPQQSRLREETRF